MNRDKLDSFLRKHGNHSFSVERRGSLGLEQMGYSSGARSRPVFSDNYVLDISKEKVSAVYCCGKVCK